jgi:replicative DNA helicase
MELSITLQIPVVLASQLNREAYSPTEMAVQNIAEASDIEHSANIVLLLWNSAVKPTPKSTNYYKNRDGELTKEAENIEKRGFKIGEAGTMYAILAKNRSGERGIDAVLQFNGNTGKISYTATEQDEEDTPF